VAFKNNLKYSLIPSLGSKDENFASTLNGLPIQDVVKNMRVEIG
jgi:hypothetical protein